LKKISIVCIEVIWLVMALLIRANSAVDEDWLDESLRGLQTVFHLDMASGSRRYSRATEGVRAKLTPSAEHGNIVNIILLWDQSPKSIKGLPIRHVVPHHPTSKNMGDSVVFIRGPLKAQFRVVDHVDGERVFVSEIGKKKSRSKGPALMEHSLHDVMLSQWPKKT
jgi:hypothetical protein